MKKLFVPLIVLAILCLLVFFLLNRRERPALAGRSNAVESNASPPARETVVASSRQTNAPPVSIAKPAAPNTIHSNSAKSTVDPQFLSVWQTPINFYGKVLDENDNPVSGASVNFTWQELPTEDGRRNADTVSDGNGLFSLDGRRGRSLSVSISKEGYYTPHHGHWEYNYALGPDIITPDSSNPVIFHLHKKGQPQELIVKDLPPGVQIWQLHHDGTAINLDLFNGAEVTPGSGQLKLEFWRDVSDKKAARYDWKFQLSVPNGGLIPTPEEFAFEAPQSGYQPSVLVDMPATNQNWIGEVRGKYYFQLADGRYGRIDVYLLSYNGVFTVHSCINPSGSRNLEPAN